MQYQPLAWHQAEGFDYETAMFFSGHTANELSILIKERTDTGLIELNFDYQSALFTETSIKRIQTHLLTIVENAVRNPNRLIRHIDMADEKEKKRVLTAFNRTETAEPPAPTLHGLFTRRAALSPHCPALRFPDGMLTYAELDRYTDRLAVRLRQKASAKKAWSVCSLNARQRW